MELDKKTARKRRHNRIRAKIKGTEEIPRLIVFRSLAHTYAQIIDDTKGKVLAESSDLKSNSKATKVERAKEVGMAVAKIAMEKKINEIVFDRNGYKYHGRVKAVAEGAREGGLKF